MQNIFDLDIAIIDDLIDLGNHLLLALRLTLQVLLVLTLNVVYLLLRQFVQLEGRAEILRLPVLFLLLPFFVRIRVSKGRLRNLMEVVVGVLQKMVVLRRNIYLVEALYLVVHVEDALLLFARLFNRMEIVSVDPEAKDAQILLYLNTMVYLSVGWRILGILFQLLLPLRVLLL